MTDDDVLVMGVRIRVVVLVVDGVVRAEEGVVVADAAGVLGVLAGVVVVVAEPPAVARRLGVSGGPPAPVVAVVVVPD